jgi:PEP-CTERM motif
MRLSFGIIVVACCGAAARADIQYFTDQGAFAQFNQGIGKSLKGIENFEESLAGPGEKHPFPNSLQNGVPRPTFPNGIDATNLIIQTNITLGPCPPLPNPSASDRALWVNGAGFLGSNSIKVGTDEFLYGMFSSIDLIFTSHDKTAVGVDVSTYPGFNSGHTGFTMCIYDPFENVLGTYVIAGPTPTEPGKDFFGVWSSVPIGRINIWGSFDIPQPFAVDNIEMWVPEPSTLALLGVAGFALLRRRRSL